MRSCGLIEMVQCNHSSETNKNIPKSRQSSKIIPAMNKTQKWRNYMREEARAIALLNTNCNNISNLKTDTVQMMKKQLVKM